MAIDGNFEDDDGEGLIARGKVEAVAGMAIMIAAGRVRGRGNGNRWRC
jgi:hypothetical protein